MVYYENYVLNYGLPMGTGQSTNECVGGWYKFEFKGTHKFSNDALCLYGENRRYRFLCFNRYRTLRRVTQVNASGNPLWFSEDYDADGPEPIMEFQYASQSQLSRAGAAPSRLQTVKRTIGFKGDTPRLYVENYWDYWGGTNSFVSLTKGDSRERYYLPGMSFNMRTSIPGRSSVSRYAVKRDAVGRDIEYKFDGDCDLDGMSRITYAYKTEKLENGCEFVYPNEVRCYQSSGRQENLIRMIEFSWDGLTLKERVSDLLKNEFYEIRSFCQSRSLATALRTEKLMTDNHFERRDDKCDTVLYEYSNCFNLTQMSSYSDRNCTKPYLRKDNSVACARFSWTDGDSRPIFVETLDENGQPMAGILCGNSLVSKIEWQYVDGQCVEHLYVGTNSVLPILSSVPFGYSPSTQALDFRLEISEKNDQKIVSVILDSQAQSNDYLNLRSVFYKENRDEGIYPNERPAYVECYARDGTLSTNAVSCYYTYRQGLPVCVEYKRGAVLNGEIVSDQSDYYEDKNGLMLPAISMFEYDNQKRVLEERHLDRKRSTNALPSNMVYVVRYTYEGGSMLPKLQILISACMTITNELSASGLCTNLMEQAIISGENNALWTYRQKSPTEVEWRGRVCIPNRFVSEESPARAE